MYVKFQGSDMLKLTALLLEWNRLYSFSIINNMTQRNNKAQGVSEKN